MKWVTLVLETAQNANIAKTLTSMQETSRNLMGVMLMIELIGAIGFLAIAAATYWFKIRNQTNAGQIWKIVALISGLIGLLIGLFFAMGLISYLLAPTIANKLAYG
ncbi:hypothetical protein HY990_01170 [Candidatus Micrarchaeota archaeon]|nr:hypothetical protein [Candidatus Micrarchaeota archaeon]